MTKVLSHKYPGLYVGDVGVQFVDGVADVDDERTLARLRKLDHFGVRVVDGDEHDDEQRDPQGDGRDGQELDAETLDYDELTDDQLAEIADARNEAAGDESPVIDNGDDGFDRDGLIEALRAHDESLADEDDIQSTGDGEQGDGEQSSPEAPKKSASQSDWATYAAAIGVDVPADTKRNDIIAAVEAASV